VAWADPDFLEGLRRSASGVSIAAGDVAAVDIAVVSSVPRPPSLADRLRLQGDSNAMLQIPAPKGGPNDTTVAEEPTGTGRRSFRQQVAEAQAAELTGIVVSDENPSRPVRRALVRISGMSLTADRVTVTGDDGRFHVTGLPSGHVVVAAAKAGFVPTTWNARGSESGHRTLLQLRAGVPRDIRLVLPRGGVIAGTVTDQYGRRVQGSFVRAPRIATIGPSTVLRDAPGYSHGHTDDLGSYRLFGLPFGPYVVEVSPPDNLSGDFRRSSARQSETEATSRVRYSPLFYPGTTAAGAAVVVRLEPGTERAGVDVQLRFVTTARVTGRVQLPVGLQFGNMRVELTTIPDTFAAPEITIASTAVGGNGRFSFPAVKPGRYRVSAMVEGRRTGGVPTAGAEGQAMWAEAEVQVDGRDVPDVSLVPRPAMSVSGRVVFMRGDSEMAVNIKDVMTAVRVRLRTARTLASGERSAIVASVQPSEDGFFALKGVRPGRYIVTAVLISQSAGPWAGASVTWEGRELQDTPLIVQPDVDVNGIQITVQTALGQVSGRAASDGGEPVSDAYAFLFPADDQLWLMDSWRARAPTRLSAEGGFEFSGLPPGKYYVAITATGVENWQDPVLWKALMADAHAVTVESGTRHAITIVVGAKRP
jgi:hypothetical protein